MYPHEKLSLTAIPIVHIKQARALNPVKHSTYLKRRLSFPDFLNLRRNPIRDNILFIANENPTTTYQFLNF